MSSVPQAPLLCPECGADFKPGLDRCWLCYRPVPIEAEIVEPEAPPVVPAWLQRQRRAGASATQFSLETLLLVVTLVAVCLGMIMAAPGFGVLASIVAAPALIRTLVAGYQQRSAGQAMTLGEKVLAFLASTGVTIAVLTAGLGAFGTACFATCLGAIGLSEVTRGTTFNGEWVLWAMLLTSAGVGIATAVWLFWLLLPRKP